jgi:serine/threonine protein kinase/WD40 repeat protein
MLESLSGSDLLNDLAHEFAERYRRGERPSLNEYADRHPELAGEIRELFPTLVMIEQFGSGVDSARSGASRRPPCDIPVPESLGDYRILREIGRGGMGVVYEAVQESLGRRVALKVLSQHRILGSVQLQRFEREAKAAALLHHTNIVPVFGVGEHEGVHYYAMQFIEGQSLDTVFSEIVRLRGRVVKDGESSPGKPARLALGLLSHRLLELRTPVEMKGSRPGSAAQPADSPGGSQADPDSVEPVEDLSSSTSTMLGDSAAHYFRSVARLGMQAAEALAYAHQHGLVHRDIKPANLLLDLRGTLWVTDFGLAKAEGALELTSPGDVVGTLRYLAPERFHGKADPCSDIYSLGLTLYELLTFAPAFTASHRVEYIHAILHEEPARPRSVDPRIPLDLETIVLKSISKNPSDRYHTADLMARELGRFVEGRPILSRRVSLFERGWRWSRRNRVTAALIMLAASLSTILAIGSTAAAFKFRDQRNAVWAEEQKTRNNLNRALEAEREREAELGRSLLRQARAVRYSGQPGRRSDALKTLEKAAEIAHAVGAPPEHLAELRDEMIAALALIDDHPSRKWSGLPAMSDYSAASARSDRYVDIDRAGLIHVRRLSDQSELRVLGADRAALRNFPKFVPGGRFVCLFAEPSSYELWDLEKGEIPGAWPAETMCVAARGDGASVAALSSKGQLRVYDLPLLKESSRCEIGFEIPKWLGHGWMSLSEDGRQVALFDPDGRRVGVYDVKDGRLIREFKMPHVRVDRNLALNRNAGLLAVVHDRAISVFDMADGEQLSLLQGHLSEGIRPWFQPAGDLLATSSWDGTTRLWDPIRGRLIVTLDGGLQEWVADGSGVILGRAHEMVLNQITAGVERRSIDYRTLGEKAGAALFGPARISYSPDGQLLAMAVRPEGVRIARQSDGAALAFLPIGYCDEVLFTSDGDLLTYNDRGLCRWPVRRIRERALRLGPPEPLALIANGPNLIHSGLAASADGRIIGVATLFRRGSMLLDRNHPWRHTLLTPHRGAADLAISPDGRWACSGSRGETAERARVKVWDVSTGLISIELPLGNARVAFSPDSRWLGVGGKDRYRFFETGNWKAGQEIEQGEAGEGTEDVAFAFHPSSRFVAVLDPTRSIVKIVELESGSVRAVLRAPDPSTIHCLVFSPDGRYLAIAKADQRVDLWD